jgi:hypothetical protein
MLIGFHGWFVCFFSWSPMSSRTGFLRQRRNRCATLRIHLPTQVNPKVKADYDKIPSRLHVTQTSDKKMSMGENPIRTDMTSVTKKRGTPLSVPRH